MSGTTRELFNEALAELNLAEGQGQLPLASCNITAAELIPKARFAGFDKKKCAAGGKAKGVTVNEIPEGKTDTLFKLGWALIESAAPITEGADIASDADGKAKVAATGDAILGIAENNCTVAGELILVWLKL